MKVLLVGYGQMGKMLESLILASADLEVCGIIDVDNVADLETEDFGADVVIDFSGPSVLPALAAYVRRTGAALVSGATGYPDHGEAVKALGAYAPVIYAENYSVGVNAIAAAVAQLSGLLGDGFEVELIEAHHRYKKDAPSGTAQLLLRSVDPTGERPLVYGRGPEDGPRRPGDIGVHSVRGGTVPGEHTVAFFGEDEVITVSHEAFSRKIFANGALTAARSLACRPAGSYTLDQLLTKED